MRSIRFVHRVYANIHPTSTSDYPAARILVYGRMNPPSSRNKNHILNLRHYYRTSSTTSTTSTTTTSTTTTKINTLPPLPPQFHYHHYQNYHYLLLSLDYYHPSADANTLAPHAAAALAAAALLFSPE